jgi:hypothetical protein
MSAQLIIDQIITNVRDAISTVSPMDVMIDDRWESIPYTYDSNTGVFKFEFQGITFECKLKLEVVQQDGWDKLLTQKLCTAGLSWEHARLVVGVVAEERMAADIQGYARGYDCGYVDGKARSTGVTGIDRVA